MCEDTHTNYWPEYGGGLRSPTTFVEYAKQISDTMNKNYWKGNDKNPNNQLLADHFYNLVGMHFYDSIVVMDKAPVIETKIVTSTPI
jgi:hypothetical protein